MRAATQHRTAHPLAGESLALKCPDAPVTPVLIEDWLDRVPDDSPTALATPAALASLMEGDGEPVIYGHIGSLAVLVHASDLSHVVPAQRESE